MGRQQYPHLGSDVVPSSPSATTSSAVGNPRSSLLERRPHPPSPSSFPHDGSLSAQVAHPLVSGTDDMDLSNLSRKSQWITLAVASGACAAFNGVFAKLTTTTLTTSFATAIAKFLGLGNGETVVEVIIRAMFFGLNLIFNAVMWALFTKALARGTSTTQVSVINTSSNFMVTAILGFIIFAESLPPQWWIGAALLVAGNVIIGRREEKETDVLPDVHGAAESGEGLYSEDENLLGEELALSEDIDPTPRKSQEGDDILDLDLDHPTGSTHQK